jgi:3-dehydroquinate dehydratase-1
MGPPRTIGGIVLGPTPRIVAAGGDAEVGTLATAEGADLVELRADLFDDPRPETVVAALARLRTGGRPIILTVRAAAEGGRALDDKRRRALYLAGLPHADAIDIEIASSALMADVLAAARAAGRGIILSAHVLDSTPAAATLLALVDRGRELGAQLVKLATEARELAELQTLLEVTLVARSGGIVTLAMGPMGPLSRLVLPAAGSLLTYGSVGRATAPGQIPVAELAGLCRRFFPTR